MIKGAVHEDNLRGVCGSTRRAFEGNGYLCGFERNGIVDAVADKANKFAFVAQLFD